MEDKLLVEGINSKGFGTIAKLFMKDRKIHSTAKCIYSYFCSYAGGGETCFPSRSTICYDLNLSVDTFSKYLKQLINSGYIRCSQVKESGRFSHNIYTICTKIPCPKISDTVNTTTEITVSENTVYGNTVSDRLDTNINSININNNKNNNINKKEKNIKKEKHKYGEYDNVLLTDDELEKLKNELPNDYEQLIENLSYYIKSKGNPYQDHCATIRNWARKNNKISGQPVSKDKRLNGGKASYSIEEYETKIRSDYESYLENVL